VCLFCSVIKSVMCAFAAKLFILCVCVLSYSLQICVASLFTVDADLSYWQRSSVLLLSTVISDRRSHLYIGSTLLLLHVYIMLNVPASHCTHLLVVGSSHCFVMHHALLFVTG